MHDIERKERQAGGTGAERFSPARPWYREPWPWILISGPAAVIVASFFTLYLAVASSDGLVADDYYKEGLGINRVLAREDAAERLGLIAHVDPRNGRLRVRLQGRAAMPEALAVRLAYATRAGFDRSLLLARAGDGSYQAALPALPPGHWRVYIDDARRQWRLAGEWRGGDRPFLLEARPERTP
ncbi:MAG TPA: FixH family protein [Burkholderiales bacterium]|nr:FixH family protein [Burkholderiales bacterium]